MSRDDVWLYLAVEEHESGLSHFECALSNDPAQQYRTCPVDRDNPLKINLKSVKLPAGAWVRRCKGRLGAPCAAAPCV